MLIFYVFKKYYDDDDDDDDNPFKQLLKQVTVELLEQSDVRSMYC